MSSAQIRSVFADHAQAMGLPSSIVDQFDEVYHPVVEWIESRRTSGKTFVLGVNGAQGSGKSTFCDLMKQSLQALNLKVAVLSIDDLYFTRSHRAALADTIHPLCAIRGVPGTHDVQMGLEIIQHLRESNRDTPAIQLPRFNKATDDRHPVSEFETIRGPIDVVLFEGWCVGEPPLENYAGPYNDRERRDDPYGIWAKWSQAALNHEYQTLNATLDALVMIKVPSFEVVRQSRWLQERKLHESVAEMHSTKDNPGLMSKAEVMDYVDLFEKHTEHMFNTLVDRCDVLIERDAHFNYWLAQN